MTPSPHAGTEAQPQHGADPEETRAAAYRYGLVFFVIATMVVFTIVAPEGTVSRAVGFAFLAMALLVAITTSRERTAVRRRQAEIGGTATIVITLAVAVGLLPDKVTFLLSAAITLAIPVTLGGGLLRLVRTQGVTLQAVAGALAIYLLIGLSFAYLVGFVAAVGPHYYFAQRTNGTTSEHLYYSFTVLTTTGFGDFTAAYQVGRALAVTEMLVGQLYLVTVIGVLVGRRVETAGVRTRPVSSDPPA